MIVGAAFCPHPPSLVPQLAQGAAGELAPLRAAAVAAVRTIAGGGVPVLVLGSARRDERFAAGSGGSMAGFGVDVRVRLGVAPAEPAAPRPTLSPPSSSPPPASLPLSLTVGAWLLREALGPDAPAHGWSVAGGGTAAGSAGPDLTPSAHQELVHDLLRHATQDCALLVMADGSARRSTAAPGYLDDRAARFDAQVAAALASGAPAALAGLDPVLGAELLASGVPAWHAAATVLASSTTATARFDAALLADMAPYGVGYFVATWRRGDRGGR